MDEVTIFNLFNFKTKLESMLKKSISDMNFELTKIFNKDAVKQRCFLHNDKTILFKNIYQQLKIAGFIKNAYSEMDEIIEIFE